MRYTLSFESQSPVRKFLKPMHFEFLRGCFSKNSAIGFAVFLWVTIPIFGATNLISKIEISGMKRFDKASVFTKMK